MSTTYVTRLTEDLGIDFAQQEISIRDLLTIRCEKHPDKTFAIYPDEGNYRETYQTLYQSCVNVAGYLYSKGLKKGSKVAFLIQNGSDAVHVLLGIMLGGFVAVPIKDFWHEKQIADIVAHSDAEMFILSSHYEEQFPHLKQTLPLSVVVANCTQVYKATNVDQLPSVSSEDEALLVYTSGTTSNSKGVLHLHRGIARPFNATCNLTPDDIAVCVLPLYNKNAMTVNLLTTIINGSCLVIPTRFRLREFWKWVTDFKCTWFTLVPAIVTQLLYDKSNVPSVPHVRFARCSSAALANSHHVEFEEKFAIPLLEAMGSTETGGIFCNFLPPKNKVGSPGVPNFCQVRIVDEVGEELPHGEVGEFMVKSRGNMHGYYKNPELTAMVQNGEWCRTGDLGYVDREGYFFVVGRKKDIIIKGGQNIFPQEIEEVLIQHTAVRDVAVIGKADELLGEDVVAYVILCEVCSVEQLQQFCAQRLTALQIPCQIHVVEEFPRNSNGKVQKWRFDEIVVSASLSRKSIPKDKVKAIADIWSKFFDGKVDVDANFFELGGNSLELAQILNEMRVTFGVEISLEKMFRNLSIRGMASLLEKETVTTLDTIVPIRRPSYPLSYHQQQQWLLEKLYPERSLYNKPHLYKICGNLDIATLEKAFNFIIERHQVLRTNIIVENDIPQQTVFTRKFAIEQHDLSQKENKEKILQQDVQTQIKKAFDFERDFMLRAHLYHMAHDEFALLIVNHHIATDRYSMAIFFRELKEVYTAILRGQPPCLPPLSIQYKDYACWQQGEQKWDLQLSYWKEKLHNYEKLQLPCDFSDEENFAGATEVFTVATDVFQKIQTLAHEQQTSLFILLHAVFHLFLSHYSQQRDIVTGFTTAGRHHPQLQNLIGYFINTLVLRSYVEPNMHFTEYLAEVNRSSLEAYQNQDVPFEKHFNEIETGDSRHDNPIFNVMFALNQKQNIFELQLHNCDIVTEKCPSPLRFPLSLSLFDEQKALHGEFRYRSDVFAKETIERMVRHFQQLLQSIANNPRQKIHRIQILTKEEMLLPKEQKLRKLTAQEVKEQVSQILNFATLQTKTPQKTTLNIARHFSRLALQILQNPLQKQIDLQKNSIECDKKTVIDLLRYIAKQTPQKNALLFEDQAYSYDKLEVLSDYVAANLRNLGVTTGVPVVVMLHPSIDFVIALFGVLKSGATCVPLNPDFATERSLEICENSFVVICGSTENTTRFRSISMQDCLQKVDTSKIKTLSISRNHAAFIIYTSGSTGAASGVIITHENIASKVQTTGESFPITKEDICVLTASVSFVACLRQVFVPLCNGASLVIVPSQSVRDPMQLFSVIAQHKVNAVDLVPSYAKTCIEVLSRSENQYIFASLQHIRQLVTSGERLPVDTVKSWQNEFPQLRFANVYGQTETTAGITIYTYNNTHIADNNVPIGKAVGKNKIYLLDRYLQPVIKGAEGEVYVEGPEVARGYYNDARNTVQKYIPNPFAQNGQILYKTGDIAKINRNDDLEILSRMDSQIKIRGYRIDPIDIETALRKHPSVQQAAVVCVGKVLKAYLQVRQRISVQQIRKHLQQKLAEYMIPQQFFSISHLPQTMSGKTDYRSLSTIDRNEQYLFVPQWQKQQLNVETIVEGNLLVFTDENEGVWHGESSINTVVVRPSKQFSHHETTIYIDFDNEQHYAKLGNYLQEINFTPQYLLYVSDKLCAFLWLVQQFSHCQMRIAVANSNMFRVRKNDRVVAQNSLVVGAARVIPLEHKNTHCTCIDVDVINGNERNIIRELQSQSGEVNIAYRQGQRLVMSYREAEIDHTATVKNGEVYLISGGLGNIGLEVAMDLAKKASVKIVLTTRSDSQRTAKAQQYIQKIQEMGSEVFVETMDFTLSQVTKTIDKIVTQIGPINTVMHCAGTREDFCPLQNLQYSSLQTTLAAKVEGAQFVINTLQKNPPQRMILFSSLSSLLGRYAQMGYCAANAYLDALAQSTGKFPIIAVNWDVWKDFALEVKNVSNEIAQLIDLDRQKGISNREGLNALWKIAAGKNCQYIVSKRPEVSGFIVEELPTQQTFLAAKTSLEKELCILWQQALNVEKISIRDNFFDLGGHSLLAINLMGKIRNALCIEVPLNVIFEAPTIEKFAQKIDRGQSAQMITALNKNVYPLASVQKQVSFVQKLQPQSSFYNMSMSKNLVGELDKTLLQIALEKLVVRQSALRTVIEEHDRCSQQKIVNEQIPLSFIDVNNDHEKAQQVIAKIKQKPFKLSEFPLVRFLLVRLTKTQHIFTLVIHHVICDHVSMQVMWNDIVELYNAEKQQRPAQLRPLTLQYGDFCAWQQQQSSNISKQYWLKKCENLSTLNLPTDKMRPVKQSFRGAYHQITLQKNLEEKLCQLAQENECTLFMVLLAAFNVLLSRYSNQDDIVMGFPITDRYYGELDHNVGFFINNLILRNDLSGNPSFVALLKRVRQVSLEAYTHQNYPFEDLVFELNPIRDTSRNPIFQVYINMLEFANVQTQKTMDGVSVSKLSKRKTTTTRFDITLYIIQRKNLSFLFRYSSDLFFPETIERMAQQFMYLLESIVATPWKSITQLPMQKQQQKAVVPAITSEKSVMKKIARIAQDFPNKPALIFQSSICNYRELDERSSYVSAHLRNKGVTTETPVVLLADSSLDMIVVMIGILKSGAVCIPVNPHFITERTEHIFANSFLIVQNKVYTQNSEKTVLFDSVLQKITDDKADKKICMDQAAFIIYTSGSTGAANGVVITHRNIASKVNSIAAAFPIGENDTCILTAALSFVASLRQILTPLCQGARLVVVERDKVRDPRQLFSIIAKEQVTIVDFVPSYCKACAIALAMPQQRQLLKQLKVQTLITSGERLPVDTVRSWLELLPDVRFANVYGQTETTAGITLHHLSSSTTNMMIPVGKPTVNSRIYILDNYLQPVPQGVEGEIYVAGEEVARGYYNDVRSSATKFIANPFSPKGGILYRTGDWGRENSTGEIEISDRKDAQIKIRGYRVDKLEIEIAIREHPKVQNAAVVYSDDVLKAFIVEKEPVNEIFTYLQDKLPEYMIPQQFFAMSTLPTTTSGKVDYRQLCHLEKTCLFSPTWQKSAIQPQGANGGPLLVIGKYDAQFATQWSDAVIFICRGTEFVVEGNCILMDFSAHYSKLQNYLATQKFVPQNIVYCDRELAPFLSFSKMLNETLTKAKLIVVCHNVFVMEKYESVCPSNALVVGASRVVPLEYPGCQYCCIDMDINTTNFAQQITNELKSDFSATDILYKNATRYVRSYQVVKHKEDAEMAKTYLITGGLGRIGRQISHYLAQRAQVKIAITTRCIANMNSDALEHLENIRALGAEIAIFETPLREKQQLQQTLCKIQKFLGDIDVVMHCAGAREQFTPLANIDVQNYSQVLDPKVTGTKLLIETLGETPPKCMVLFSSLSSILGRFGQASYCAANAFLDALAHETTNKYFPTIAINWDVWKELPLVVDENIADDIANLIQLDMQKGMATAQALEALLLAIAANKRQVIVTTRPEIKNFVLRRLQKKKMANICKTALHETLCRMWQNILKVEDISVYDNFFALGGHSLLAIDLIAQIKTFLNIEIPLHTIFEAPTIYEFAEKVEEERNERKKIIAHGKSVYPLSPVQQQLWFLQQLQAQSSFYNMFFLKKLQGDLDIACLKQAVQILGERQSILRTVFQTTQQDTLQQTILSQKISLQVEQTSRSEIKQKIRSVTQAPFTLSQFPLVRFKLFIINENEYVFCAVIHHILSDHWSMQVMWNEIVELYNALQEKREHHLPDLNFEYGDFCEWLQQEDMDALEKYWLRQCDHISLLHLPTDKPRPAQPSFEGERHIEKISGDLQEKLRIFSQENNSTLFSVLLTSFNILLSRYSNQEDVVIGFPVINRHHGEMNHNIGLFINNLVLRNDLSGQPTFVELLARVQKVLFAAYRHQDYPFQKLVEKLNPTRDTSRNPIFQVYINMLEFENMSQELPMNNVMTSRYQKETTTTRFDLTLYIQQKQEGLAFIWRYSTDLFVHKTIVNMAKNFVTLLQSIIDNCHAKIYALPIQQQTSNQLSFGEKHAVTQLSQMIAYSTQPQQVTKNAARYFADYIDPAIEDATAVIDRLTRVVEVGDHSGNNVIDMLAKIAKATPEKTAIICGSAHCSYRDLLRLSTNIAANLHNKIGSNNKILLLAKPSSNAIATIFAILKSGNICVPLNPDFVPECNYKDFVIVHDASFDIDFAVRTIIRIEDCLVDAQMALVEIPRQQAAFIICTSGSTGIASGVVITHENITSTVQAIAQAFPIVCSDVCVLTSSFAFVAALRQIMVPLCVGATLIVSEDIKNPVALFHEMGKHRVTVVDFVPSYARLCAEVLVKQRDIVEKLHIKQLVTSGEKLTADIVHSWQQILPDICIANVYGQTETTAGVSLYRLPEHIDISANVPIGTATKNTKIYILDAHLQEVKSGEGEIYISSSEVARGYYNNPQRTALQFIPNPFEKGILYKTGDIGRYNAQHEIEIFARKDQQIKIRGQRVDHKDIENVMRTHAKVKGAAVIFKEQQLQAYIVADDSICLDEIRVYMQQKLPQYMIPQQFFCVEQIPVTLSGKVDYLSLAGIFSHEKYMCVPQWCKSEINSGSGIEGSVLIFSKYAHEKLMKKWPGSIRVSFGEEFKVHEDVVQMNMRAPQHFEQLSTYLKSINFHCQNLVYADHDIQSFLLLMKIFATHISYMNIIVYSDRCNAQNAFIRGALCVLPREYPGVNYCYLDVDSQSRVDEFIIKELENHLPQNNVQYRNDERYSLQFTPLKSAQSVEWQDDQVFLITGGLGNIGLEIALFLARNMRAKIAITTRCLQNVNSKSQNYIHKIEALGSEVAIFEMPLSATQTTIDLIEKQWGKIYAVFHCAGSRGNFQTLAQIDTSTVVKSLMAYKAETETFIETLLKKSPQVVVLFSSLSSFLGRFGQIEYCAANAYLDTIAQRYKNDGVVAANWDVWKEIPLPIHGDIAPEITALIQRDVAKGIANSEALDTLTTLLYAQHPQIIISKRNIGQRIVAKKLVAQQKFIAPQSEIQKQIAAIWREVLHIQQISIHDNFFHIGGHSLLAIVVMNKLRELVGLQHDHQKLPLSIMLTHPTIFELEKAMISNSFSTTDGIIEMNEKVSRGPQIFLVHGAQVDPICYQNLAQGLNGKITTYAIRSDGLDKLTNIEDTARYHVAKIKSVQPQGPYVIGGMCFGGLVALEVAQQLIVDNNEVELLFIMDLINVPGMRNYKSRQRHKRNKRERKVKSLSKVFVFTKHLLTGDFHFVGQKIKKIKKNIAKFTRKISNPQVKRKKKIRDRLRSIRDEYSPQDFHGKMLYIRSEKQAGDFAEQRLRELTKKEFFCHQIKGTIHSDVTRRHFANITTKYLEQYLT